ncbi:MAG: hypothetical protein ROO76_16255 [Terriglobia bacterium]|nr:hypothetical protein [Terriglobia bacterium]
MIEGSLGFQGSTVSGTVHIALDTIVGSCFLFDDTIQISGSVDSSNKIHLVTSAVAGEGKTLIIDATLSEDRLSMADGTYQITGGCADGYSGTITAAKVSALDGHYVGSLSLGAITVPITADLTQAKLADSVSGYFQVTGTLTMSGDTCPATFTLAASAIGNYVQLYSNSGTGLEALTGKVDPTGQQITLYDYYAADDCTAGYQGVMQRQ